jgi:hypothetical protein
MFKILFISFFVFLSSFCNDNNVYIYLSSKDFLFKEYINTECFKQFLVQNNEDLKGIFVSQEKSLFIRLFRSCCGIQNFDVTKNVLLSNGFISTGIVHENVEHGKGNLAAVLTAQENAAEVNTTSLSFTRADSLDMTDKELKIILVDRLISEYCFRKNIYFITVRIGIPGGSNCFSEESFYMDYDILKQFGFTEFNPDRSTFEQCIMTLPLDKVRKKIKYL